MFESDDFDEALSQFDLPDALSEINSSNKTAKPNSFKILQPDSLHNNFRPKDVFFYPSTSSSNNNVNGYKPETKIDSPKHIKRKIVNSFFDHNSKRKFPGPAGLLSGNLEDNQDDSISHMELLSQDVNFTQNQILGNVFETPLWTRLKKDIKNWSFYGIDSISTIKRQEDNGKLQRRKAHTVIALVETVDRSPIDPLVILRDTTGHIKCTLHRDAWSTFSTYIVPEYCALVLWKPTILTTGSAFKKYYLNITLSNILALYSSAVTGNDTETIALPDGFCISCDEDVTIIRTEKHLEDSIVPLPDPVSGEKDLLDDLDNIFSEDLF